MTLRLAFMGTPDFAVPALAELLAAGHDIAAVYTQPPRPAGRGHKLQPSPVELFARAQGLKVCNPTSFKSEAEREAFTALDLDAAVVAAYGLILPQAVLDAPRLGCFNIHASLLPRWRGAAPIQRAILAGDAETGVCAMKMDAGLDTGPVLARETLPIHPRMNAAELHDRLAEIGAPLMLRALHQHADGKCAPLPQAAEGVTYASKLTREEGKLDWRKSAAELDRAVRGLNPAPGTWFEYKGERIKLLEAEPVAKSGEPGSIIDEGLVACGEGALRLLRLQRAGRPAMQAADFLRGFALDKGEKLG